MSLAGNPAGMTRRRLKKMKPLENIYTRMRSMLRGDKGATMVEYALMVVAIALVALVGVKLVGTQINTTFETVKTLVTPP
jgi:Flp pilus assembly pilin Flp